MRFGMERFALICSCACGVEIAQACITQSVNLVEPREHLLDEEFRFAVGICRVNGIVFFDGSAIGRSEERGGGTENETRNFVGENGFEQRESVRGVVAKVRFWKFHRFAGFDGSSHVDDAVEFIFLEKAIECCAIAGVAFDESCAIGNGGFVTIVEIVVDDDVVAAREKLGGDDATDVAGASGDEYAIGHGRENPSGADWLRRSEIGSGQDYIRKRRVMPVGGDPSPSFL